MSLIKNCKIFFGTDSLYDVLNVEKTASESEVKKAYKKASLIVHPDRVSESEKENATRKFQVLAQVYFILSDEEKRNAYDETGCIDEENAFPEDKDWNDYWRLLFPKLKMKDVEDFMEKYKGSEEETEDLKKCYVKCEGDMDQMSEHLMGYTVEEEDRYRLILSELIDSGDVPSFPNFIAEKQTKKNARTKKMKKEAKEAEEAIKKMKMNDNSLEAAIARRTQERESQFDDMIKKMESKYVKQSSGSGRKKK